MRHYQTLDYSANRAIYACSSILLKWACFAKMQVKLLRAPIDCNSIVSRYLWVGNMTHFLHDIINFSLKKSFAFHSIILGAMHAVRLIGYGVIIQASLASRLPKNEIANSVRPKWCLLESRPGKLVCAPTKNIYCLACES